MQALALTELVKPWHENAAECVLQRGTPFFDDIRGGNLSAEM